MAWHKHLTNGTAPRNLQHKTEIKGGGGGGGRKQFKSRSVEFL